MDREQIYESFNNGLISLDDVIDISIKEYKKNTIDLFKKLQFKTGRAWFDFDAGIDRCVEIMEKVSKQFLLEGETE